MGTMNMLREIMNYLMDPFLVARIQNFFGVDVCDKVKKNGLNNDESNERCGVKKNGYLLCESDTKYSTSISNSVDKVENNTELINNTKILLDSKKLLPVTNYFWYYLFLFSSELGDEIFYTAFITIWFWNIDAEIGRKVILVWGIVMTIGQIMKDIIRWPRPACPPAVRLQNKWSLEYGMPSTHASVSVSIPFSIILFTMNKYNYSITLGIIIVLIWSTLICISRLYLGMHSVLDVIAGLLLAIILMIPLIPIVNYMDHYFITNYWSLVILIAISIIVVVYYPTSDKWTPTRNDTTMVVSVVSGIHVGAWLNYYTGIISFNSQLPPYDINLPTYTELGQIILRTILGFCFAIPLKLIIKLLVYTTMCGIKRINAKELMKSENSLENRNKIIVDLVYRFIYCFTFGIVTVYVLPLIFAMVGLSRPGFYNGS
ncbi:hypothetical protein PV328_011867 [Microctonus aethiopoides]|uniref:Phosphatidic acid phosphatase type 2/haloperoxidase domain-containing protein n=1 Tax=Microctonus aethiopoides TaxID=144406 RepID=A0AA39FHA4_9HYME|nr:hypothetical protein PV328_011867 [Microctonus aethiopoides]